MTLALASAHDSSEDRVVHAPQRPPTRTARRQSVQRGSPPFPPHASGTPAGPVWPASPSAGKSGTGGGSTCAARHACGGAPPDRIGRGTRPGPSAAGAGFSSAGAAMQVHAAVHSAATAALQAGPRRTLGPSPTATSSTSSDSRSTTGTCLGVPDEESAVGAASCADSGRVGGFASRTRLCPRRRAPAAAGATACARSGSPVRIPVSEQSVWVRAPPPPRAFAAAPSPAPPSESSLESASAGPGVPDTTDAGAATRCSRPSSSNRKSGAIFADCAGGWENTAMEKGGACEGGGTVGARGRPPCAPPRRGLSRTTDAALAARSLRPRPRRRASAGPRPTQPRHGPDSRSERCGSAPPRQPDAPASSRSPAGSPAKTRSSA